LGGQPFLIPLNNGKNGDGFMKDKITKIKIFLSILAVIGFGTGCNDNQNQLDEDNNQVVTVSNGIVAISASFHQPPILIQIFLTPFTHKR
jgi:hypothetical protein